MPTASAVSSQLQDVMKMLDRRLEEIGGEKLGFFLLVYAGGEVNYASTDGDRKRAASAMREIIEKWESGVSQVPAHQRQ